MRGSLKSVLFFTCIFIIGSLHATDIKQLESEFTDSMITTKITSKYTENKQLNPLKITVSTHQSVVTLNGYVKNKSAFNKALQLAKTTKGVQSVQANNLLIKRVNTSFTDAYITTKVEGTILKAKILDDESIPLVGIKASTNNGVVTLSGEVKNRQSLVPLLKRIAAVKGVTQVVSHLTIMSIPKGFPT
jgi:hyperosmotically inducible periplasmic protein